MYVRSTCINYNLWIIRYHFYYSESNSMEIVWIGERSPLRNEFYSENSSIQVCTYTGPLFVFSLQRQQLRMSALGSRMIVSAIYSRANRGPSSARTPSSTALHGSETCLYGFRAQKPRIRWAMARGVWRLLQLFPIFYANRNFIYLILSLCRRKG